MNAHEFTSGADRCIHCGTLAARLIADPECPCVPHGPVLRPEPTRRQYASEDYDTIEVRLRELEAEKTAGLNLPATPD